MADWPPLVVDQAEVVEAVGNWMATKLGAIALEPADYERYGNALAGWRLRLSVAGHVVAVDLIVDADFPFSTPEAYWNQAPPFPNIPHVEENGKICALPASISCNPLQPIGVVSTLLSHVEEVLGSGLRGENDEDFRIEFRSYWNAVATGVNVISIVDPCEPSRAVRGWWTRKSLIVAEDKVLLRRWAANNFGKSSIANSKIIRIPFIWLPTPLLPSEYPATEKGLAEIVSRGGDDAIRLYREALSQDDDISTILLGSDISTGGVCLGAVSLTRRRPRYGGRGTRVSGFRTIAPDKLVLLERGRDIVTLSAVSRADPWWVHGRDSQDDLETLLGSTVALFGCGSLGSPVARLLAQAGVGELVLVDPDHMAFANIGRHALGADSVAKPKAAALRDRLAREFPHLKIRAWNLSWQGALAKEPDLLRISDLCISTMGEWQEESALNLHLLAEEGKTPTIYAWSEPHAVGGHAVMIGQGSGCLACGLSEFGGAKFSVAAFSDSTLRREPACGAFFQPYGSSDMVRIAALCAKLAIDALQGHAGSGEHRIVASTRPDMERVGGKYTEAWIAAEAGNGAGDNQLARHWGIEANCAYCRGRGS
jgi:hypothetical protein